MSRAPKRLGPPPLRAMNDRQEELLHAMEHYEQVVALGPAGTGKTFLAAAHAADQLERGRIRQILITRPTVAVGDELGFFPGTPEEKIAPWTLPLIRVLRDRLGKDRLVQAIADEEVQTVPLQLMRGWTLDQAFVICDEAQNATPDQIKMLLTRHGRDCTMLINGDLRQSDLPKESGLARMIQVVHDKALEVPIVEFTTADCVRSGVCRMWTEAWP